MLTREQAIQIIRDGGKTCHHGLFTDEAGAAFLLGKSERTLKQWRSAGIGPRYGGYGHPVYDVDELVRFYNEEYSGVTKRAESCSK